MANLNDEFVLWQDLSQSELLELFEGDYTDYDQDQDHISDGELISSDCSSSLSDQRSQPKGQNHQLIPRLKVN